MKRAASFISYLLLLHLCPPILYSQQDKPDKPAERVIMFTDRTLYIAGEKIFFAAFLQSGIETNPTESSRILYCELISPAGNKIVNDKFLIKDSFSTGDLKIPEDIITGNYYLRAYTRYMRNWGPYAYYYSRIKIVNAKRSEVQALVTDTVLSGKFSMEGSSAKYPGPFHFSTDKSQYYRRDTIILSIGCNEDISSSWKGLSLSVVPEYSESAEIIHHPFNQLSADKLFFYSETRGLSVTGKITDSETGNIVTRPVNLSIIGRGRDFMVAQADSAGRFFFSLPDYTGYRDLFLCTENSGTGNPKIMIDNDFCTIPVHLPVNTFTLSGPERQTAFKMAANEQLNSYFNTDSIPGKGNSQPEDQPFYGRPDEILYIDNYVQLPSLEDYFNELPTLVKIRKRQGEKYFKILGNQTGLLSFDPLILVDHVAIGDPSKVLTIPPATISKIEVVNTVYIKGAVKYGGIVNIITKRGDFGGIDLPSSGIFINFKFLANADHYPEDFHLLPHYPDTRNTLHWEPQLVLNNNSSARVSFTASDTPGRYLIILNGIDSEGSPFRQTGTFEIIK